MISEKERALSTSHERGLKLNYELNELKTQKTELCEQREKLDENKPIIEEREVVGNAEQYQKLTKGMLVRYLPTILEDLQFIRVKGVCETQLERFPSSRATKRTAMKDYLEKELKSKCLKIDHLF